MEEHILITDIRSNPNVGLFGFATDKYCLLGSEVPSITASKIEKILKVPVHKITIGGSSLVGVFVNGNSNMLLVPDVITEKEKKVLDDLKIKYYVVNTKFNTLGNNIICNDNGCLVSKEYSADTKKRIRQALDVPLKLGTINEYDTVGSMCVLNSKGLLVTDEIKSDEKRKIKELFKVPIGTGTVNLGSAYVRSGIIANSNGFVISSTCGGPEISNADEILGFLD